MSETPVKKITPMDVSILFADVQEAWVPVGEDGPEALIRFLNPVQRRELVEQSSVAPQGNKKNAPELDINLFNRNLGRAVVRDWRGITSAGIELPFTPENLDRLMTGHVPFANFVSEACRSVKTLSEAMTAAHSKNSASTSGQN